MVTFTDDAGNEINMEIIDYFFHDGLEYAVLMEACTHDHQHDEEHEHTHELYIMQVVLGEDEETEEFVPVAEDLFDTLCAIVDQRLQAEDDEDEEDEKDD